MKKFYKVMLVLNALFIGLNIGYTIDQGWKPLIVSSFIFLSVSTLSSYRGLKRAKDVEWYGDG